MTSNAVELVRVTPDAEKLILFCARVSSDQANDDPGLIRYLVKHGHWSPFELSHMVLEIKTSRAIAAQLLRHRSFSFQEFSQRYSEATSSILNSGREQSESNRQSSLNNLDSETQDWWQRAQKVVWGLSKDTYDQALQAGVSRECARMVLPLSTETTLYMCGSVRSWIHYIQLRTEPGTQLEHRDLASEAKFIFCEQFPITAEALGWP